MRNPPQSHTFSFVYLTFRLIAFTYLYVPSAACSAPYSLYHPRTSGKKGISVSNQHHLSRVPSQNLHYYISSQKVVLQSIYGYVASTALASYRAFSGDFELSSIAS